MGRPCCILRKRGQRWLCQSWSRLGIPIVAVSAKVCVGCWMVAGSAINRSVSVSNPIASIKTQKDICKTRLLAGEKAWPRLLRYFSQSWCWALCRVSLPRLSCSLKFVLVFYILLQGCLLWSPSCYVAAKFKEERRERYLLFSFAPLPFCWISRWRPKKKHKNTAKYTQGSTKLAHTRSSTTVYYKAYTNTFPALLCTTKLAQSRSQYYFVLQSLHKIVPSTTVYYKACTKALPSTTEVLQLPP